MKVLLYVVGWTSLCAVSFWELHDNWFWPVGVVVFAFIWLVGLPLVMLAAVEKLTRSLPDDEPGG